MTIKAQEIRFENPPPRCFPQRGRGRAAWMIALRERPGEWAHVSGPRPKPSYRTRKQYPGFEFAHRRLADGCHTWARFIGLPQVTGAGPAPLGGSDD